MEHAARKHVGKSSCLSYLDVKAIALRTLSCVLMNITTDLALICLGSELIDGFEVGCKLDIDY
jgi:hypothetical protein